MPDNSQPETQPRPLVRVIALLWVVVIAIIVAFGFFASSLCITFLLAGFLAILLDPIPSYFQRLHVPRLLSTAVLVVSGMLLVTLLIYVSYNRATTMLDDMPEYAERIRDAVKPLTQSIEKVQKSAGSITAAASSKRVQEVRVSESPAWPSYLIRGVGSAWGAVIVGGLVPFLMFFMLVRKSHLYDWLANAFGEKMDVPQFTSRLTKMVRGFALGNLIIGAAMAAITVAVFYELRLQGAVPLGIASGFLNLVPFIGAILAAALPLLAATLQYDTAGPYLIILLTVFALHLVSSNFLVPKFIGSRVNIGPVAATMGILFWGWMWGVMGILLAVPLTAFVKLVSDCHPSLIHISNLLAETPRPVPNWAQTSQAKVTQAIPFLRKRVRADGKD
ncbi:MAG: AI-2E family transporter [Candidatus Acidiferrum sp.]|jgi:predicted PurR-regulated permease PerM